MDEASKPLVDLAYRPRMRDLRRLTGGELQLPKVAPEVQVSASLRISRPEQFIGRKGYEQSFLGDFNVEFPKPRTEKQHDVTPVAGDKTGRLDYEHFSIVMSGSRRIAMFTAVNIEGARSVSVPRNDDKWSLDGRIPVEAQLGEELYLGNRLDRGHLVRREDPNWGSAAKTANADTFHFTNCAPQMDVVNQRTWLGLENYILQNARAWKDRCSVFTGPVLAKHDLKYREAQIPAAFWKVVAFLNDDGKPSATAYLVEQDDELWGLKAAFGKYKTYQRSIRSIEDMSGISMGTLSDYDAFSNEEAAMGGLTLSAELIALSDVRV
ncbi:DNA/RNA non-specific endonuclease [Sinorhizobium meliloti]|uniref:DNA/RNA non-specific endonuclease n=1 Tax=Rhizobium meliloti TaxID=382 RepID=UPI000FDFFCA1|nr:DNA/RNA non-specific endonuclease [Sinorhizobium meliloti]RVG88462.1 DNA/RNA non-specific endonuclease [Sinorhizobium meliloti]RVH60025.1 DNA/RNA non-specific endonuclease [Sinorhizobium meliloti]